MTTTKTTFWQIAVVFLRGGRIKYAGRQLKVHINAPFLDIFGCARHSPNKFGSALACTKICFEIFGCARQYEQALLHSLARKLAAARHNPSKLGFCSRLAQTFLKMRLLAKLIATAKHQRGTRPTARPSLFMAFHTWNWYAIRFFS